MSLPYTTSLVIIHTGTNYVHQNQPKDIAFAKTFTKKQPKIPSLLACYRGTRRTLFSEQKSMRQTRY